jgi:hypothetical protein
VKKPTLALSAAALLFGCGALLSPTESHNPLPPRIVSREKPVHVVLIALDGVRASDVFEGADPRWLDTERTPEEVVPNLSLLAREGITLGRPGHSPGLSASGPNFVSLPGYTELLSGRFSECHSNDCSTRPEETLIDWMLKDGTAPAKVGVIASWENIEHALSAGPTSAFVSTGRHGGNAHLVDHERLGSHTLTALVDGADAPSEPGHHDYRPDHYTIELALAYLEDQAPRFMFVGLGDTDEHAHAGDYEAYLNALQRADAFVGRVMQLRSTWEAQGEPTAIFVTTDHGRGDDFRSHGKDFPESRAVWLIAAGARLRAGGAELEGDYALRDIAPTIAAISELSLVTGNTAGTPLAGLMLPRPMAANSQLASR